MKTINVEVAVQLAINISDFKRTGTIEQITDEVLNEMNYNFTSKTKGTKIVNSEIVDSRILEDELPWHD